MIELINIYIYIDLYKKNKSKIQIEIYFNNIKQNEVR